MKNNKYQSDLTTDEKLLMAIVRATENFRRVHSAIFRKYGLSFPQYNTLRVLEASEDGRNKISAVGKIMLVPGANMTGIAKRLEREGFIDRISDPSDERVTLLKILPKGRRALKDIRAEKDASIDIILSGLSTKERISSLKNIIKIIKSTASLNQKTD